MILIKNLDFKYYLQNLIAFCGSLNFLNFNFFRFIHFLILQLLKNFNSNLFLKFLFCINLRDTNPTLFYYHLHLQPQPQLLINYFNFNCCFKIIIHNSLYLIAYLFH